MSEIDPEKPMRLEDWDMVCKALDDLSVRTIDESVREQARWVARKARARALALRFGRVIP
jgi:hypothetical protein